MRKTLLAALLLLALCPPHAVRAQTAALSLDDCLRLALTQNKQSAAASAQTQAALYTRKSFRANFFPSLTAQGTALYSTADGSFSIAGGNLPTFLAGGSPDGGYAYFPGANVDYKIGAVFIAGVQMEQPIYTGGKLKAALRMQSIGVRMAQTNERLTAIDVMLKTIRAYTDVVRARELLTVANKGYEALASLRRDVGNASRHGLSPKNDLLKVQVKLNECELDTLRAHNALRLASMNLCHIIGLPLTSDITLTDTLPEPTVAASGALLTSRPEYELIDTQVQLAEQEVRLNYADKLPQIGIVGNYSYMNGMKVSGDRLLDNGYFSALLNLAIPLYHFGERTNRVRAAKAKLLQTRLQKEDLDETLLLELALAENNLREARLEARLTESSLSQASENMRVSRSQYLAGLETLSEHLEAQALWQQAYASSVEARCKLHLACAEYLKASGRLAPPQE